MDVELRFFANVRDAVGRTTVYREFDGETVRAGDVRLFDGDGSLREFIAS